MKRTYAGELKSSTAFSSPIDLGTLSEADQRLARAEALLRDANNSRIEKALQDEDRRQAVLVAAARAHGEKAAPHAAHYTMMVDNKDGTHDFQTVVLIEPSAEVVDLMDHPQPMITGLMWAGLEMPDRIAMLETLGLSPDLVLAEGPLDIFPEQSKQHLLRWQKQINSGAIWHNALSVGRRAEHLIEEGYLLYGLEPSVGEFHRQVGRNEIPSGRPGTPAFIKAVMGRAYLNWLLAHEEHPIEA